jgi:hypothetical protein
MLFDGDLRDELSLQRGQSIYMHGCEQVCLLGCLPPYRENQSHRRGSFNRWSSKNISLINSSKTRKINL